MTERVTERHIVAIGGGAFGPDAPLFGRVMELTGAERPRVCYVPTATGDSVVAVARFYSAFDAKRFVPSHLALFDRTVADVDALLADQDAIVVSGGNTLNMLAVWRLHGVDLALRTAWEAGVVLCGGSAGANCWFEASTTDSFLLGRADPLVDGLGFLPGSFCPHFDAEPARRPSYHRLVAAGELPAGIACDDDAAVHWVGTDLVEAIAGRTGAGAYRVEPDGAGGARETPIPIRLLS